MTLIGYLASIAVLSFLTVTVGINWRYHKHFALLAVLIILIVLLAMLVSNAVGYLS